MIHNIVIITKNGKIRRSYVVLTYTELIDPIDRSLKPGWVITNN